MIGSLSTRAYVGSSEHVLISGVIIRGDGTKRVLIRGLGASLTAVAPLEDPYIELIDGGGNVVAANNNWKDSQQSEIAATGRAPAHDAESALIATIAPGAYTLRLSGMNNGAGVGHIDIIDVDTAGSAWLDNMSSRSVVAAGDGVLVGGFTINSPSPRRVMIRGIGPSMSIYVSNPMYDPTLRLRDESGNQLVFNDDWEDTQADEIIATNLAPADRRESAIVATLSPGSYTAELLGACSAGGLALVEVYDLGATSAAVTWPGSSRSPRCFKTWAAEHSLSGPAAAAMANGDGDADVNLLEYAFGKDPNVNDGSGSAGGTVEVEGVRYLSLSFTRPTGTNAPDDLVYLAERSATLGSTAWSSGSTNFVMHSITPGPGDLETVTVRSTRAVGSIPREFLRLKVTLTSPE